MQNKPLISAVIPCYNHGKYLDDAVESILSQTYCVDEIIIVNDGSDDEFTKQKLSSYNDSKITIFNISNSGPSAARNYGIKKSKGDFVFLMDADDYCHSSFIEKAVHVLQDNKDVGGVSCGVQLVGNGNKRYIPNGGNLESFLLEPQALNFGLIRKTCLDATGGYDESMKRIGYEDWDFWIMLTKLGFNVYIIKEYLFYYRWHSDDSSRRIRSHKSRLAIIQKLVEKHRDSYCKHIVNIVVGKEIKIKQISAEKLDVVNSLEYRIGAKILKPLRFIQKILKNGT